MNGVHFLDFDSQLFGFRVARLLPSRFLLEALQPLLERLKAKGVALVYGFFDPDDQVTQQAARACGGFLADRKLTYVANADALDMRAETNASRDIEPYDQPQPDAALEALALQVGLRSRFSVDPRLAGAYCKKMYLAWIANCVRGIAARRVLVAQRAGRIVGMVTVGEKQGRGDIGLIAVDEHHRGQGMAGRLVRSAQACSIVDGYSVLQVVTQLTNEAACRLYERSGYRKERLENVYHFWLGE